MNLCKNVKITKVGDYESAGTGAVNSTAVDMQGWDGVLFLTTMHVANSGNYINAAQGDLSNGSDAADLEGTKVVCEYADVAMWLDIYKPIDRYVRVEAVRAGSSTAMGEIWAIQYSGRIMPQDNDTMNTITGKLHISPAEGTA